LAPGASAVLAFTTAAPGDRNEALALAGRFRSLEEVDRVFEEAAARSQAQLAEQGLAAEDAALFQRLAAPLLYTRPALRSAAAGGGNDLGQPGLWPHAISGDLPIALLRIGAESELGLARQGIQAHGYWRSCGLVADLVVLNDAGDDLRLRLENLLRSVPS